METAWITNSVWNTTTYLRGVTEIAAAAGAAARAVPRRPRVVVVPRRGVDAVRPAGVAAADVLAAAAAVLPALRRPRVLVAGVAAAGADLAAAVWRGRPRDRVDVVPLAGRAGPVLALDVRVAGGLGAAVRRGRAS